jgi:hypothetical protein
VPQGAPTSSTLANLALLGMHLEIQGLIEPTDSVMTAWVDDFTLSGPDARDLIEPTIRIIQRHRHAVKRKKLKIMPSHGRQDVTGVNVNRQLALARFRRAEIRADILRHAHEGEITEAELRSILGRISHARWLSPRQGTSLGRFAAKMLPDVNGPGKRSARDETRSCQSARRHKRTA